MNARMFVILISVFFGGLALGSDTPCKDALTKVLSPVSASTPEWLNISLLKQIRARAQAEARKRYNFRENLEKVERNRPNWQSRSLSEGIERFLPIPTGTGSDERLLFVRLDGKKIVYRAQRSPYEVIEDVDDGYFRVYDQRLKEWVDWNGNLHPRPGTPEFFSVTHFNSKGATESPLKGNVRFEQTSATVRASVRTASQISDITKTRDPKVRIQLLERLNGKNLSKEEIALLVSHGKHVNAPREFMHLRRLIQESYSPNWLPLVDEWIQRFSTSSLDWEQQFLLQMKEARNQIMERSVENLPRPVLEDVTTKK